MEGEKKRLRTAALAVEQRFQDLVQELDAIVWEADAATWRFSFVSQRAEAILGYPVERWLTEPDFWAAHIHPDDRERAVSLCQVATSEGKNHQFEYRALAADGRVVWLRDIVRVAKGADGHARQLRGVMVDITPLKEAEEALAERTRRLEAVRAVTEEITRELDLATLLGLVNRRAAELVGAVSGGVYLWDDAAQVLIPRAWYGLGKWMGKVHLQLGEGIGGTVAERREGMIVNDYRTSPYALPLFVERTGITATLAEPLLYRDRLLGVITINNEGTGRPFTEQDRESLALFAAHAAIAIENARLLDAREEAKRVLEQLYTVGVSLHASRELGDRLGNFLHGVQGVVRFDRVNVFLLSPDQSVLDLVVSAAGDILTTLLSIPLDSAGPFAEAIRTRRLLLIERKEDLEAFPPLDQALSRLPFFRSTRFVVIPLVAGDQVVGVVGADNKASRRPISPASVEQLQLFCQQLAVAIDNARLHETTFRRAHQLVMLNNLARTLTTTLDPQAVGREILAAVQTLIPGAASRLWECLADEEAYSLIAGLGVRDPEGGLTLTFRPGEGLIGMAALTRQPVMSRDVTQDPRFVNKAWAVAEGLVSGIVVPLLYGERVAGALAIFTRAPRDFTDEEVDLLRSFAAQAAIALENARLVKNLRQSLDDLEGAQEQLVRGATLRAVGEMASGMAHHLNNLLAVVLGRIELLLQKVQEPEIRRSLEIVGQATREGAEVVRRVQGFSRMKPISEVVPVDLNQLVSEVLELVRPVWQDRAQARGIQIQASLEPGLIPAVAGEPASLREVIVNLLLNAVEALPVGGKVTVKTWVEDQGVYCSVSDTGVGMVEEVQRRVPEPFFTTKGPKATGLGLSLSYAIIQRHGGDLAIESAEGRGTTVTIRLPVARAAAVAKPRGVTLPAPTLTILVIDDEAEVLDILAEMLTNQGHKVLPATGGLEGLARLEAGEPVDLVLTDLGMPGMTGWEVARAVKVRWPHLPVGLVTGWGEVPEALPEERRWVDFVLAKPVTLEALREATGRIHPKSPAL